MCLPKAPTYAPTTTTEAPGRTDADVAKSAEDMRRAMNLSEKGWGKNFKMGEAGGEAFQNPPLKKIVLGA